jgi:hypothetical protein
MPFNDTQLEAIKQSRAREDNFPESNRSTQSATILLSLSD